MSHPNLSDEIKANLEQSDRDGGVRLLELRVGDSVFVETQNSMYRIAKKDHNEFTIEGHPKYCPEPTPCKIHGSTWGGSMLKIGFIGNNMHLEFSTKEHRVVTTSRIKRITVERVH